jgi:hypothetical protein
MSDNSLPIIEEMYTAIGAFDQQPFPCGYMIEQNVLYVPRGTPISKLEQLTGSKAIYIDESDPSEEIFKEAEALFKPRNHLQEESIKFLTNSGNHQLSLNLKTGFGKGLPLMTRIPAPNSKGYILMSDIKVGDIIFDDNGKCTTVLGVYPQGEKDIYEITFSDERTVLCDESHLWYVKSYIQGRWKTKSTAELMKDYKVYSQHKKDRGKDPYYYKYRIPLLSSPVEYPHRDVPIHPYVLGAFIGNGCCREIQLTISSGDDFVPNKIAELCGFTVRRNSEYNYSYQYYDKSTGRMIYTKDFFRDIPEMINCYSRDKRIPIEYMVNDYQTRIELMRGLMDTDGSISNRDDNRFNILYSSCSKRLLEQIQELIWGFGFIAKIHTDKRIWKYVGGFCGSLSIRVPQKFKQNIFTHPRKYKIALDAANVPETKQLFEDLRIKNIKFIKKGHTQCIRVDSPNHLFLTEKFIVTHNTFCVAAAITKLNRKAIIILPNNGLKYQWMKDTFIGMFTYQKSQLMDIAGSQIITDFMENNIEPRDIYFVTHAMLRNYLNENGGYALGQFFKKLKVEVKVYDESHMEFANIINIDHYTNTNRTWYLTATFDRSDKSESACFKRAFANVEDYGEIESHRLSVKHVLYHVVNINSRPTRKEMGKLMGWGGFTSIKYGRHAFFTDPKQTCYRVIEMLCDKVKDIDGKTLIFTPLIESCDLVAEKLKKKFPEKRIAVYHSKADSDDRKHAFEKDIIVTTIKSCGTGKDIKDLRTVISAEPYASKNIAAQAMGRLRNRSDKKDTLYFDIVDIGIPAENWWLRARMKVISMLAKEVIYLNMEE